MRVLVFDTETDGVVPNPIILGDLALMPRVTEFYGEVIEERGGEFSEEVEVVNELIRIDRPIDDLGTLRGETKSVSKITGITDDDIKDKPRWDHFADRIRALIESCDYVVAHNVQFDMMIVDSEMSRFKLPPVNWPTPICTIEQTGHLFGRRISLTDLHMYLFGKGFVAHRAGQDVKALIKCFIELRKREEILYA